MPQSKEEKQRKAIERNRDNLSANREVYLKNQPGGELYKVNVEWDGKEEADRIALEATKRFHEQCKAANCDTHGNPLENNQHSGSLYDQLMKGPK